METGKRKQGCCYRQCKSLASYGGCVLMKTFKFKVKVCSGLETPDCSFTPCLIVCCRFILQSASSWCGRLCCRNVSVNIQYTFWPCLSLSTTSTQTGLVEELFCFMSFSFESGPSVSYTLIMLTFYHTGQLCKQVWIRLSVKGRQNDVDGLGSHITVEDVFG